MKPLLKRYRNQEGRGTDGFGYVSVNSEGYVNPVFRCTEEKELIAALSGDDSTSFLLHHRLPTSLPNYAGATHPLAIKDERNKYDYYIVHNGVISNYKYLWGELKKEGHVFMTEMREAKVHAFVHTDEWYEFDDTLAINDSEVVAIDVVNYIEGRSQLIRSSGTIAVIGLQCTKDGKVVNVFWLRNAGKPLQKEEDKTLFCLRSEGQGQAVDSGTLYVKDFATGTITSIPQVKGLTYTIPYRTPALGYAKPYVKPTTVSTFDDDLDETIRKLLPPTKDGGFVDKSFDDFGRTRVIEEDVAYDLPVIEMEDLGFSDEVLAAEIDAADAGSSGDGGVIRQLRLELIEAIDDENDSRSELNAARDLLRTASKKYLGKPSNLAEVDEASALVQAARDLFQRTTTIRRATEAELSAYVSYDSPKDE